jgi:hypothetical protein
LKTLLTTAPILKQADERLPFVVKTDASSYAIGAVLVQGEAAEEHPVEYASRLLTAAEQNYSTTEREALAVIWALNKFRGYIESSPVTVVTDHQALRWLLSLKSPSGRLARWALQLQPYALEIKYAPGRTNFVADMLSRPVVEDQKPSCGLCPVTIDFPTRGAGEIREEQTKDASLMKIIDSFEKEPPNEDSAYWSNKG